VSDNKEAPSGTSRWLELAKLLPQMGWLAIAVFLIWRFSGPLMQALDQRHISKLGVGIVQIEFVQEKIETAARSKNQHIPIHLKGRIERASKGFFDAAILWVDDNPAFSLNERRALASLGVTVDTARSSDEALKMVAAGNYDLVVSDFNRDEKERDYCFGGQDPYQIANAGCHFMRQLQKLYEGKRPQVPPPLIFFTSFVDPEWGTPVYAFGATTRVDEFFHLAIDALERRRIADGKGT
jgi:CheY-like chemotaxis protein